MVRLVLILSMIFMHIVDDYYLQAKGILASMKQKKWWEENYPDKKYENDYIVALLCHAFSWSFMINLPIIIVGFNFEDIEIFLLSSFINNLAIHAIVDDQKANWFTINLVQDQIIHLIQIIVTYVVFNTIFL